MKHFFATSTATILLLAFASGDFACTGGVPSKTVDDVMTVVQSPVFRDLVKTIVGQELAAARASAITDGGAVDGNANIRDGGR